MILLRLFKDLVLRFPKYFILLLFLILFQSLLNIMSVIAVAPITDFLMNRDFTNASKVTVYLESFFSSFGFSMNLLSACLFFAGVMLFNGVVGVATINAILKIKFSLLIYLLTDTLSHFFKAQFIFFSQGSVGKLLNSFQQEVQKIGDTFGNIAKFLANLFQMIILLLVPLFFSPKLTFIFLISAALISSPLWFMRKTAYRLGRTNTDTANKTTHILQESLNAAKLILGFARQKETVNRYQKSLVKNSIANVKFHTVEAGVNLMFLPFGIMAALIALYSAYLDNIPLGEMALVLFAFVRLTPIIGLIIQAETQIVGFLPAYEQLKELSSEAKRLAESKGHKIYKKLNTGIEFKNVSFSYLEKDSALNKINLKIKKSKMTALIGKSGSGKTTIADLILGFYQKIDGEIFLENTLLKEYNLDSFREKVGLVPQDPQLLNATIRENLLWSNPKASEKDIWEACKLSNSEEFIFKFPNKLDTVVGDRGIRLSGGQRQRISLARAIIRKPDLLILDEATSSLDTESEKLIQESIESLSKDTTILVIAHRMSTIQKADYVYVLNDGKIAEEGSYKELSKKGSGKLAKMISDQEINFIN